MISHNGGYISLYCVVEAGIAGSPKSLESTFVEVDLNRTLLKNPQGKIIVRVRGESMNQAGVLDCDHLIVDQNRVAHPGDLVVAWFDGSLTVKQYFLDSKKNPYLKAANIKEYPDLLYPQESLSIVGVVTGSYREYE